MEYVGVGGGLAKVSCWVTGEAWVTGVESGPDPPIIAEPMLDWVGNEGRLMGADMDMEVGKGDSA